MKKEFNINASSLNNFTEKQIESTINKYSKRELLERLLTWKSLAKQHEATIDELIKSYQLEKTAQKRLQEAAEQRKAVEAEKASTEKARQEYEQALEVMSQQLQQATQPKDDTYWNNLYENDPLEYVRQRDQERDAQAKQQAVQSEQLRMRQIKLVLIKLL